MAEENNDDVIPQPKPFPPKMLEGLENETVAHQVRDYLWGKGPIDYGVVSAHLNRTLVLQFVEFEMRDLPPQFFWRVRILADLYNLKEILKIIQMALNRQETKPVELDRSIANTIILEEIGDEAQKKFARQYYEYMVSNQFAKERFAELIECLAAFGYEINSDSLRARMEQEIKSLASREMGDEEAGMEKRYIQELVDNNLFFVEESAKSRQRIDSVGSINQRLLELIRAYLELTGDGGAQYFDLWLQQQIRRTAEAQGSEIVIQGFRRIAQSLDEIEGADEIFCKARAYNAIEFFLGKLTTDEKEFMKKNRHIQVHPLRYMPIPLHIPEAEEEIEEEETEEAEEGDGKQT